MSDATAIRVENLSKKFLIGHQVEGDLRGSFSRRLGRLLGGPAGGSREEFWALKDVSFDIKQGEAVGIIGRNGAGKSTLLKILSRITYPTTGRFEINGRVSSLLEVGTGFHQELTGRENIYLNGTILGMRRTEIRKKFDAIVDFSGVEKFLDTPVKHYSSGMKVRLAFSVAAHLEPEILIIDEVLAVGDAEFQKKCLGKMDEVSKQEGRTVLFVSHDMTAIANFCSREILLFHGNVKMDGSGGEVIKVHLGMASASVDDHKNLSLRAKRVGNGKIRFQSIEIEGRADATFRMGQDIAFKIRLSTEKELFGNSIYLAITIFNQKGMKLTTLDNLYSEQKIEPSEGYFDVACRVPNVCLLPGEYRIDLWCADAYETYDLVEDVFLFTVEPSDIFGTGKIHNQAKHGEFIIPNFWYNNR